MWTKSIENKVEKRNNSSSISNNNSNINNISNSSSKLCVGGKWINKICRKKGVYGVFKLLNILNKKK